MTHSETPPLNEQQWPRPHPWTPAVCVLAVGSCATVAYVTGDGRAISILFEGLTDLRTGFEAEMNAAGRRRGRESIVEWLVVDAQRSAYDFHFANAQVAALLESDAAVPLAYVLVTDADTAHATQRLLTAHARACNPDRQPHHG